MKIPKAKSIGIKRSSKGKTNDEKIKTLVKSNISKVKKVKKNKLYNSIAVVDHFTITDVKETKKRTKKEMTSTSNVTSTKHLHNNNGLNDSKGEDSDQPPREQYLPGMLTECLQKKKYGHVLTPWGSTDMDEETSNNDDVLKRKINPLYDLSKRQVSSTKPVTNKDMRMIFVGNLPKNTREYQITKLFGKCGKIENIKIQKPKKVFNPKQKPNVNAKITFDETQSCDKALELNGVLYKNCHLRVMKEQTETNIDKEKCVFVGNLHFRTQDDHLWKTFEVCGQINNIRVIRKPNQTSNNKIIGYINFKSEDAVEKAIKLDGLSVLERKIRVRKYESNNASIISEKQKKAKIECKTTEAEDCELDQTLDESNLSEDSNENLDELENIGNEEKVKYQAKENSGKSAKPKKKLKKNSDKKKKKERR